MPRKVEEWRGRTPDSKVPDHVRLRIFRNAGGVCHISGRKIALGEPWQLEHIIPLHVPGGENREGNLRPALVDPHKIKTAKEMKRKAKGDAQAKFSLGIKPDKRPIPSAAKAEKQRRVEQLPLPPRRPVFEDVR